MARAKVRYVATNFSEKLDPCPFCGSDAQFVFWSETEEKNGELYAVYPVIEIACTKCPARMSVTDGLIQNWNKRKSKRTKK